MTKVNEFHTRDPETPNVYHDDDACWEGKKILPENRIPGKGVGRRLCEVCASLS